MQYVFFKESTAKIKNVLKNIKEKDFNKDL